LGKDGGIEQQFKKLEETLLSLIANEARQECDRYVRESPRFYDEGTFSIYQFRQTLQQTSQSYGAESIIKAEPAIRQLLKLDFEPKIAATIRSHFRQGMNQTVKSATFGGTIQVRYSPKIRSSTGLFREKLGKESGVKDCSKSRKPRYY
jgi:hypothetical protein